MKVKILIVDDHPAIRHTMRDVMESEGFQVELAKNGKEAIELYAAQSFDFVLIDMQMPDIKGVVAHREMIKSQTKKAKFIFISAFSAPELEQEAHELGCTAFLKKPIRVEKVIELIRSRIRSSVLVFIENKKLCDKVIKEIKSEGFNLEVSTRFDDTLIRIRQIDYNFLVIDEDSAGIEQEGIKNTIEVSSSETEVIQINEDEPISFVTARINNVFLTDFTI
jgi:DNA-binding NtrC family response regulator